MNNPFMDLSPAEIDVLDDMITEWNYKDRHGQLNYRRNRSEALGRLNGLIAGAYSEKVYYQDVEEMDD